jgi:hypothetical protein
LLEHQLETTMQDSQPKSSRRGFFLTASAAGAAVAATSLIKNAAPATEIEQARPAPLRGGGYTVSEHVKRYYKTTLV